jgi:beta-glucanase (GH16 family)
MNPILSLALLATISLVAGSQNVSQISITRTNRAGETYAPGDIIFEDNFDFLDFEKWGHEKTLSGGGNWEFQVYDNTRDNSYARGGILYIKPTLTNDRYGENFVETGSLDLEGGAPADECTNPSFYGCARSGAGGNIINPAASARLRTVDTFTFKYGRVEVRAKLPSGDWLWPAIWMMPRYNAYGGWPASGEIDIMESRGNLNYYSGGVHIGKEQASSTLHFGPYWPYNGYERATVATQNSRGFDSEFHTYGVEWTNEHIRFTIDGAVTKDITPPAGGFWELGGFPSNIPSPWGSNAENPRMAPFDQKFYLIINLAVGGTNGFFPDDYTGTRKPWSNTGGNAFAEFWAARNEWYPTWVGENAALQIDYVRVYAV